MALTADQVYLLNTLGYLSKAGVYSAKTDMSVEQFVSGILDSPDTIRSLEDPFQSVEQIRSICDQILSDPTLCAMKIEHASRTEGGADCLIITTPDGAGEKQAVVVFEGTVGGNEWRDNFEGGAKTDAEDGVSTLEQERALEWYESDAVQSILADCDKVTVSGHSKGGNKAKYITLLDKTGTIDECISFDGQGFSDEFVDHYSSEIMRNQSKITNYNNSNDYVNILLNDVGEIHYVEGCDVPSWDVYHSLFTLHKSVPLDEHYTKQNPLLAEADQLFNSFLRTISQEEKEIILGLLGEVVADKCSGDRKIDKADCKDYIDRIMNKGGWDVIVKFLDHLVKYAKREVAERIIGMLKEWFPFLSPWLNGILKKIKDNNKIPDGADIRLGNAADYILTDTDVLGSLARQLQTLCSELKSCTGLVGRCELEVKKANFSIRASMSLAFELEDLGIATLNGLLEEILGQLRVLTGSLSGEAEDLAQRIRQLAAMVERTEQENVSLLPDGGHRASPYT